MKTRPAQRPRRSPGKRHYEAILDGFRERRFDILVGTQMIAKGHDIHGVTLVGVVGADWALGMPDFRAAERTFQLLTQVAGRAGRGNTPGKVVLQTYFKDHYAVQYAARHDFVGFYEKELQFRRWMHYPPYSALANVLVRSRKLDEVFEWSGVLGQWFERTRHEGVRVLASSPHLNNVVVLDLSNNPLGESACRVLLDRKHFRELRRPITPAIGISSEMKWALDSKFPDRLNQTW